MTALSQLHGFDVVPQLDGSGNWMSSSLAGMDLLFVHRYCNDQTQQVIRSAKAQGIAVVWDNDDDLGAMPKSSVTYKNFGGVAWEKRLAQMKTIFRAADMVTAPSQVLANRLRALGAKQTTVIENYVPDDFLLRTSPGPERRTIGWIAGLEHRVDADQLHIAKILSRVMEDFPDVDVVTVGLGLGIKSDRYTHVPRLPLFALPRLISTFAVGIAPLADIQFNWARSNVKLKEYAAAGASWLASPIGPYVGMGKRQGGMLVCDEGWHDALGAAMTRPRTQAKLAKLGSKWAAREVLSKGVADWRRCFEEALACANHNKRR